MGMGFRSQLPADFPICNHLQEEIREQRRPLSFLQPIPNPFTAFFTTLRNATIQTKCRGYAMLRIRFILCVFLVLSGLPPCAVTVAATVAAGTDAGADVSPAVDKARDLSGARVSIQIDPSRNRLYLLADGKLVKSYPIAIGKPKTPTPVGEWEVINKFKNWGSGFGTRWIGLNVPWGIYGIHGTNKPSSIGSDSSHGCVRMLNRNVEELFEWVKVGTPVSILGHVLGGAAREPRRLAKGDSGGDVMLVQNHLRSAGYYHGECRGKFGPLTEQAIKSFEADHGLPVDGVFGIREYVAIGLVE